MSTNDLPPATLDRLNAAAAELIAEFREHAKEVHELMRVERPDLEFSQRQAFEGWAIQKIANLQVITFDFARRLEALEARSGE